MGNLDKIKKLDQEIEAPADFTSPEVLYNEMIDAIRKYQPSDDISMIEKAYQIALDRGLLFGSAAEHPGQFLETPAAVDRLSEVGGGVPTRLPEPLRPRIFAGDPRLQLRKHTIADRLFKVGVVADSAPVGWSDTTVETDRPGLPTAADRVASSGGIDRLLTGPAVGFGELPACRHVLLPPEDIDHVLRGGKVEDRIF